MPAAAPAGKAQMQHTKLKCTQGCLHTKLKCSTRGYSPLVPTSLCVAGCCHCHFSCCPGTDTRSLQEHTRVLQDSAKPLCPQSSQPAPALSLEAEGAPARVGSQQAAGFQPDVVGLDLRPRLMPQGQPLQRKPEAGQHHCAHTQCSASICKGAHAQPRQVFALAACTGGFWQHASDADRLQVCMLCDAAAFPAVAHCAIKAVMLA